MEPSSQTTSGGPPRILADILRHTLSLVEYYGPAEADNDELHDLRTALHRGIERIQSKEAATTSICPLPPTVHHLQAAPPRKGPRQESLPASQLDKRLAAKP